MNLLFLCLSFSTKTEKNFYEDLLREFQNNGHKVYVACANERRSSEADGIEDLDGIKVLRIRTGNITGTRNLIEKGLSTLSIDVLFQRAVIKHFRTVKFDLIMYPTPPVTLANVVKKIKKRTGAKTYLLLKDIFPQNAVDLGMLSKTGMKGIIYRYFRYTEKLLYSISDYIGCMSPANVKYLLEHNTYIDASRVEVCPNCEKPLPIVSIDEDTKSYLRTKYGIPTDKKVFVYGGNLGKPQGIEFFLQCLEECKEIKDAFMLVVGGGSEASTIKELIHKKQINNAKLIETLPKDEYETLVNVCDVGLVFLDYRFTIPNFPSRILSYMQKAKPVIVASDSNTDMGDIVEKNGFGWKCLSNDVSAFKTIVFRAIDSDLRDMGLNGRKFLEENYDVKQSYKIILKHFN